MKENKSDLFYLLAMILFGPKFFLYKCFQVVGKPLRGTCGVLSNKTAHTDNGNMEPARSTSSTEEELIANVPDVGKIKLPRFNIGNDPIAWIMAFNQAAKAGNVASDTNLPARLIAPFFKILKMNKYWNTILSTLMEYSTSS